MTDPQTPDEWQEAVEAAGFLLLLDSAMQYGLVVGGPTIDVDRCLDILMRGAQQGIYPAEPDLRKHTIGRWLRRERSALGITQRALADASGLSQAWIAYTEAGKHRASDEALALLRAAIERLRKEQTT